MITVVLACWLYLLLLIELCLGDFVFVVFVLFYFELVGLLFGFCVVCILGALVWVLRVFWGFGLLVVGVCFGLFRYCACCFAVLMWCVVWCGLVV